MVTEYWDVFCKDGFRRPIQGFSFHINTGSHSPICCKPHRYGLHESDLMQNLVERLDEIIVMEEEYGPWGAFVVLAGKPHQENAPWNE